VSNTVLIATRKGLFTLERKGAAGSGWAIAHVDFLADNVSLVLHDRRDGRLHAALDHGHFGVKMHRCDFKKRDWEECLAPAYPEKPEGLEDLDMWGKPLAWTLNKIWALEQGGPDKPGTIWCGTLPGGLFRSDDAGATWHLNTPLWEARIKSVWFGGGAEYPGLHSVCVDPRDSNTIRVGVSTGGVWTTRDGGETWECKSKGFRADYVPPEMANDPVKQDVHRLAQNRKGPDTLWVQHHNGIFRSLDGGLNWDELTENPVSTFGFAVVAHPIEPKTAWFVPGISDQKRIPVDGKLVVTRTRDGGKTFDVLRRGLPQSHCYDIVFRHGLDGDETGNKLVMASSTGNVWISEDQGDSWVEAARNLPPIYCARFA
jgi:hypothetical protein